MSCPRKSLRFRVASGLARLALSHSEPNHQSQDRGWEVVHAETARFMLNSAYAHDACLVRAASLFLVLRQALQDLRTLNTNHQYTQQSQERGLTVVHAETTRLMLNHAEVHDPCLVPANPCVFALLQALQDLRSLIANRTINLKTSAGKLSMQQQRDSFFLFPTLFRSVLSGQPLYSSCCFRPCKTCEHSTRIINIPSNL